MRISRSDTLGRFCVFNVVGALGIAVQLLILTLLREWAGVHYLPATALAVEGAVLHNFFWHESWTWSDRTSLNRSAILRRLARFNLTTGAVSIASNLGLMKVCVDTLNLHYFPANLLAITVTSIVNFLLSDRFVFPGCQDGRQPGGRDHQIESTPLRLAEPSRAGLETRPHMISRFRCGDGPPGPSPRPEESSRLRNRARCKTLSPDPNPPSWLS